MLVPALGSVGMTLGLAKGAPLPILGNEVGADVNELVALGKRLGITLEAPLGSNIAVGSTLGLADGATL